ncbi:hypothetical protein R5H32_19930 [Defluviimonas sp. D31]|uniref:hypothetical protein n=1 Tax=Defluviimonas sp. D31 TaxID=3083253 RepID=UPI00296E5EA2|nr:hypothetical protein [Defluviimonas sp. D31]MDW4551614.1 hypothetical protein [Defluviimonas sp. D31]
MLNKSNVRAAWNGVMDESKNPLRNYPISTAHMLMQTLAWMWSAIFSMAIGSFAFFGASVVAHSLIIGGIVVTLMVFQKAESGGRTADPY